MKYVSNGKEVTQEEFEKLTGFKWFQDDTVKQSDELPEKDDTITNVSRGEKEMMSELIKRIDISEKYRQESLYTITEQKILDIFEQFYKSCSEPPLGCYPKRGKIINYNKGIKETEGVKLNKNKPQMSLLFKQFPDALEAIVKCSEYGHNKYKETDGDYLNFKRVEGGSRTYADAGLRHRLYSKGTTDIESRLPHAYHVAWNALAELQLILEDK